VALICSPTHSHQSSAFITSEVHRVNLDLDTDHFAAEWIPHVLLEGLAERPQLLVLAVGIEKGLFDQLVDRVTHQLRLGVVRNWSHEAPLRRRNEERLDREEAVVFDHGPT
jgi:hypothetical protein